MPTREEIPAACLETLRRFDTPTICNVVELFARRPRTGGYMNTSIRACFPHLPPMVGYATTATFCSSLPPSSGSIYAGLPEQLATFDELSGPAVVVFQDLDSPLAAATFGELMCTTYQAFGATGLITSGAGRDLDQVERLGFPCFTSGTICAHGHSHIVQLKVAVYVGGIRICHGDLLHGDRNGVTIIPTEIAAAVADACPEYIAAEAVILEYINSGNVTPAGYAAAQAECLDRIHALERRINSSRSGLPAA